MASIEDLKAVVSRGKGFARSSDFVVTLPSLGKYDTTTLNVLCSQVNLPGRQILTQERLIGIKGRKMPSGFASDDVSMTFYVLNDYMIRRYFEEWQNLVINQDTHEISYPSAYKQDVTISQFKKGMAFDFPVDRIFGINIDIDIRTKANIIYQCKLLESFPTTMNVIELSNEMDGLVQLNVQLSYTNWKKL
jgi:hypothetical protein|tara:strand:+ start:91 stop:663 length:573 start_codon:yes stop_codon:yes gene_type:complete